MTLYFLENLSDLEGGSLWSFWSELEQKLEKLELLLQEVLFGNSKHKSRTTIIATMKVMLVFDLQHQQSWKLSVKSSLEGISCWRFQSLILLRSSPRW